MCSICFDFLVIFFGFCTLELDLPDCAVVTLTDVFLVDDIPYVSSQFLLRGPYH